MAITERSQASCLPPRIQRRRARASALPTPSRRRTRSVRSHITQNFQPTPAYAPSPTDGNPFTSS
jgi:hypothetical protein